MKGLLLMMSVGMVLSLAHFPSGFAQGLLTVKPKHPVVCYQRFHNAHDYIGVSEKFRRLRHNQGARTKTSDIEVEYIGFPADGLAKSAFQFAVEIWESELTSPVPIRIRAEWRPLGAGVLGQAIWGSAHANFGGEQYQNSFYPVALAEKIVAREINSPTEADILASFNSNASWYFGTDGKTPSGKMDLVTIVLHEIAHGLGFTDTYDVEGAEGSVGLTSGGTPVPFIFDVFVENDASENLLRNFQSPSEALASELQSANLFFRSPLSEDVLSGNLPKLYAPSVFDNGSSISHLDESTFNGEQDANKLMTPQISFAESIHTPGSVLLATLADMGWVYTRIGHSPHKDTERMNGQPYVIRAQITSDNGYDASSVKIHYTTNGTDFSIGDMIPTGTPNEYTFPLPGTTANMAYAYFVSLIDNDERLFTHPGKIQHVGSQPEQGTHFFRIGLDADAPEISHSPVLFVSKDNGKFIIDAEVTDNLGVNEVVVEYRVNDGLLQTVTMEKRTGTDVYSVTELLPNLALEDELHYRIIATDLSVAGNTSLNPKSGFHVVDVTGLMPVRDSYTNNFNGPSNDFFGDKFSIITPTGFRNGAMHSTHPYPNGDGLNDEGHYVYQLQIPIRIGEENPVIRFHEIVLVEPGEDGSLFGQEGFYDYVVVEGSADGGDTWLPFVPGYDAREHNGWLMRYNSALSGDNSQAKGDSTLFEPRIIDMLESGDFSAGDEVLIRFRLFADQLAHGWGWAIDNLAIQSPVTSIEQSPDDIFSLYPVPAHREIFLFLDAPLNANLSVTICDATGRTVYEELTAERSDRYRQLDLTGLAEGLYFLRAQSGTKVYTRKFMKLAD